MFRTRYGVAILIAAGGLWTTAAFGQDKELPPPVPGSAAPAPADNNPAAPTDQEKPAAPDAAESAAQPAPQQESKTDDQTLPPPAPSQQPAAPTAPSKGQPSKGQPKSPAPMPGRTKPPSSQPANPNAPRESLLEKNTPVLLDNLRQSIAKATPRMNVKIVDAKAAERSLTPGMDLVIHAEGGTLRDRVEFYTATRVAMMNDPYWRKWLDENGVAISYNGPPVDEADITVAKSPTLEEIHDITALINSVEDQIELDPRMNGAYVQAGLIVAPLDGPGRVLHLAGRILNESQRDILRGYVDRAATALDSWRKRRGDVYFSVSDVVVAPVDSKRSAAYFAKGLEEFWDGNFKAAEDAISRAIADDPTSVVLRYWQVLLHIASGDESRAKSKLPQLLERDPQGDRSAIIAEAFERVQGPLRWRLREIEDEVLLTATP